MNHACEICESNSLIHKHEYFTFPIVKCKKCGFIQATEKPTEEILKDFYKTYSYQKEQAIDIITKKRYLEILEQFEKYRKTNKILDFGCGQGHFLEVAKERNWTVYGNEYSEQAIQILSKKNINYIAANELFQHFSQFDVIVCIEVIEHVTNPIQVIELFNKLLRPDGLLYMTTPNIKNLSLRFMKNKEIFIIYPEHLNYFSVKSIYKLLSNKFTIKKIRTTGIMPVFNKRKSSNYNNDLINETEAYKQKFEKHFILKALKWTINIFLNLTRKGDTIKIFAVKC